MRGRKNTLAADRNHFVPMGKRGYRGVSEFIEIRLSDVAVDAPNSRSDGFTIATTLLDVEEHSGAWIGFLCRGRWMVEADKVQDDIPSRSVIRYPRQRRGIPLATSAGMNRRPLDLACAVSAR